MRVGRAFHGGLVLGQLSANTLKFCGQALVGVHLRDVRIAWFGYVTSSNLLHGIEKSSRSKRSVLRGRDGARRLHHDHEEVIACARVPDAEQSRG